MLEALLEPAVYFVAYWTGKPIVRIPSLGQLHVSFSAGPDGSERPRRWRAVTFVRGGRRYLNGEAVCLVGFVAWAIAIVATVVIARHW